MQGTLHDGAESWRDAQGRRGGGSRAAPRCVLFLTASPDFHSLVDTGARLVCNCMGMRQVSANVSRGPVFEGKESVMSDEDQ